MFAFSVRWPCIETPSGSGTGFLYLYNIDHSWCGVATAAHVVSHAEEWQQPIRIIQRQQPATQQLLKEGERVIFISRNTDSAVIFFPRSKLDFPQTLIPLLPRDRPLRVGVEVGWLGYPAIDPTELCFFAGIVIARKEFRNAYLIDGVAINGVSGGPVVFSEPASGTQIVGIVTGYYPNRFTGIESVTLPGLSLAQDVSHFHSIAETVRNVEDAHRKKIEFEKANPELHGLFSEYPSTEPPK
jgi:Trypsin-like peptidase domain